jgi:hypothetical protein
MGRSTLRLISASVLILLSFAPLFHAQTIVPCTYVCPTRGLNHDRMDTSYSKPDASVCAYDAQGGPVCTYTGNGMVYTLDPGQSSECEPGEAVVGAYTCAGTDNGLDPLDGFSGDLTCK